MPDAPIVPRMKSRRMAITRLSLFQRTTARQAQITSLSIYCLVYGQHRQAETFYQSHHYASDGRSNSNNNVGVGRGPYSATCRVKEQFYLLEPKRCLQYERNEAQSEHESRDREHEDSGWRAQEARFSPESIVLSSQFRPACSQKRGSYLTEGCGPTQHR